MLKKLLLIVDEVIDLLSALVSDYFLYCKLLTHFLRYYDVFIAYLKLIVFPKYNEFVKLLVQLHTHKK